MAAALAQMTTSELRAVIEAIVEQKLLELLGDPDEGFPQRKSLHDRLLRQKQAVAGGERGEPLEGGSLFIVKDPWMLVKTISSFTVAHSITLPIATLGHARAPGSPLIAATALSIKGLS
jgi:HupE / UreJ protein